MRIIVCANVVFVWAHAKEIFTNYGVGQASDAYQSAAIIDCQKNAAGSRACPYPCWVQLLKLAVLQFPMGPAAEFRPRWKLDYSAPEVEGWAFSSSASL